MDTLYYYADDQNQPVGPFGLEDLRMMREAGILGDATLVFPEGGTEWTSLGSVLPASRSPAAPPLARRAAPARRTPAENPQPTPAKGEMDEPSWFVKLVRMTGGFIQWSAGPLRVVLILLPPIGIAGRVAYDKLAPERAEKEARRSVEEYLRKPLVFVALEEGRVRDLEVRLRARLRTAWPDYRWEMIHLERDGSTKTEVAAFLRAAPLDGPGGEKVRHIGEGHIVVDEADLDAAAASNIDRNALAGSAAREVALFLGLDSAR